MSRFHFAAVWFLLATPSIWADPPVASYIFPAGGQRGSTVQFRVGGLNLHKSCYFEMLGPGVEAGKQLQRTNTLWFEGPLLPMPESQQAEDYPKDMAGQVKIAADTPLGVRYWRLATSQGATPALRFIVGDLPEIIEQEIAGDPVPVNVTLPVTVNGRIFPREDVDSWSFEARKGQTITCEVQAARLGSPLDSRIEVLDPQGRRIGENDDAVEADSRLGFTAPKDGRYEVRIHDIGFRGGQAFVYRLLLTSNPSVDSANPAIDSPAEPGFKLFFASDALTLNRGGQAKLKLIAERTGGFSGPIELTMDGLPSEVTAAGTTIPAQQTSVEVALKAEASAAIRVSRLTVRGSAKVADRAVTQQAIAQDTGGLTPAARLDSVLLAVALPTPFKVAGEHMMKWAPRGCVFHRRYRIDRGGFDGPLEVSLADRQMRHLQGVTGPAITVPPSVSEFDYYVHLPPWMETGRTCRVVVSAVGTIKDADGNEHAVSFSSVQPNEQIIVVVEPGRLGVEAERGSVTVTPGKTVSVPVRVTRGKGLQGPVKLELLVAAHIRGVAADAVEIPAEQSTAVLSIRFGPDVQGPFNMPAVIRATTLDDKKEPVVAETRLDLQSER